MVTTNNIEVEDWGVHNGIFAARYFRNGHPCYMYIPLKYLETFAHKNNLLGWANMVFRNNEYVDDIEGRWDFSDWVKEKLNNEIVRDFIVSHLNENG